MSRFIAVLAVALAMAASGAPSASARQVALVIGNEAYQHIARLRKSNADADAYAGVLRAKGYDVTLRHDLTRDEMGDAVASFAESLSSGDTAVFVYSGHGWSDGSQNYLLGVDIPSGGSQEFLARRSIPLKNGADGVIDAMDGKNAGLKIAIIDACRDNPFPPVFASRGFGLSKGLAPVRPPSGTFVVFSAGAGQSALDALSESDPDPNGVFTRVFLPLLSGNSSLLTAIKSAQRQTSDLARSINQEQWPAYYDEVLGEACLSKDCSLNAPASPSIATRKASPAPSEAATTTRVAMGTLVPQLGHSYRIGAIALSEDGTNAVTAGWDGKVKLWDLEQGRLLQTFTALDMQVIAVGLTPDKTKVLGAANYGGLYLWDAKSGALIHRIKTRVNDSITAVSILPDGARAIVAGLSFVSLFDLASGRPIRTFDEDGSNVLAVARDGRLFVTASLDTVKVWDVASGQVTKSWSLRDANVGDDSITALSLSPDASQLIVEAGKWQTLWTVSNGTLLKTIATPANASGGLFQVPDDGDPALGRLTAFLPTADQLLSVGSGAARIFDRNSGAVSGSFDFAHPPEEQITAIALAPNGKRFLEAVDQKLELWDVADKRLVRTIALAGAKGGPSAFSHDGSRIAIAPGGGSPVLLTPATGETRPIQLIGGGDFSVIAFSPDDRLVLIAGVDTSYPADKPENRRGEMVLADAATGTILRRFDGHDKAIASASFSTDGTRIASADMGENAKVWDVATGKQIQTFKGHAIAFLPNNREVILATEQASQIADIASGRIRKTIDLPALGYQVLPGSKLMLHMTLGGKWPGFFIVYTLFDSEEGRVVRVLGPTYQDVPLALSEKAIVTATGYADYHLPLDPKKITLRDLQSNQPIRAVGLKGPIHTWGGQMETGPGTLSPDGRQWLAFVGESWLLRDTNSGEVNQRLVLLPQGQSVDFFPDGTYVASEGADEFLAIVDNYNVRSVDSDFRSVFARKLAEQ